MELADRAEDEGVSISEHVVRAMDSDRSARLSFEEISADNRIVIPVDPREIWGYGVTYRRSEAARESETMANTL